MGSRRNAEFPEGEFLRFNDSRRQPHSCCHVGVEWPAGIRQAVLVDETRGPFHVAAMAEFLPELAARTDLVGLRRLGRRRRRERLERDVERPPPLAITDTLAYDLTAEVR